ncbi:MAG: HTH domain-containing protein [Saprospiraceae bacterium]|nr:MAG: HTH domain-containing protein [Saprospiraceae bacterium]
MRFDERHALLQRLDRLIRRKSTGTPAQLMKKLGISKATLYRRLDDLKGRGASIAFDRQRQSYLYLEEFVLKF